MSASTPAAEGTFGRVPFEHLLIEALDKRVTGGMVIEPPGGPRHVLQLYRGLVVRAVCEDGYAPLGQLLVDAEVIAPAELESALEMEGWVGTSLVVSGAIDKETLKRTLVLQLLKRLIRIFGMSPETGFQYFDGARPFEQVPGTPVRVDPLRVLWGGICEHGHRSARLEPTLERIGQARFRVRDDAQIHRFGFASDALTLAELLQVSWMSLPELIEAEQAPRAICERFVYLLAITRYLDFSPVAVDDATAGSLTDRSDAPPPIEPPESVLGDEDVVPASTEIEIAAAHRVRGPDSDTPSTAEVGTEAAFEVEESSETGYEPLPAAYVSAAPPPDEGFGDVATGEEEPRRSPARVARIKLRRVAVRRGAPVAELDAPRPPFDSGEFVAGVFGPGLAVGEHLDEATVARWREEIALQVRDLPHKDPWQLLGISESARVGLADKRLTDVIWHAYDECSRAWHPDVCPPALDDQREKVRVVYEAMTEAFMRLVDPEARRRIMEQSDERIRIAEGGAPASSEQQIGGDVPDDLAEAGSE